MTPIPAKRKKSPMGVREVEKLTFPQHRRFIRAHGCIVPGCKGGPIEAAHVRAGLPAGEQAGIATKPHDCFTVPLCRTHHSQQHGLGEASFERLYNLRLLDTALALARISTCEDVQIKAKGIQP